MKKREAVYSPEANNRLGEKKIDHRSYLNNRGDTMSDKKKLLIAIPLGYLLGYLFLIPSDIMNTFIFIALCLLFGQLLAGYNKKEKF